MAFWKMIKEGYDHFEVTRREPKVDVCEKRYVFNAETRGKFSPAERCPAYRVPQEIASAVRAKERRDDSQIADLVNRGTPVVPARIGVDGGMNPTFVSAVRSNGGPGSTIHTAAGTIPAHVNPPAGSMADTTGNTFSLASAESRPSQVQVASAGSSSGGISGFFSNLFGSKPAQSGDTRAAATPPSAPAKPQAGSPAPSKSGQTAALGGGRAKPDVQPADGKSAKVAAKPQTLPARPEEAAEPEAKSASTPSLLNGAAPTVPTGGFENRFGAWH